MASLGSFGAVRPETVNAEPDTFLWFGEPVRVVNAVNEVELIDLMADARAIEADDLSAIVVLKDGLRALVDPDDFDKFWQAAKDNRQSIEDLADLMSELLGALTGRPTQQPSDSSDGRLPTAASSPVGWPSPATRGRPDLQLIQDGAAESQAWVQAHTRAG